MDNVRGEEDEEKSDSFEDSYHPSQSVIDVEPAFRRSVPELAKRAGSSNQEEEDGYGEDFDQSMVEEVEDEEEADSFGGDDDDAHLPVYY